MTNNINQDRDAKNAQNKPLDQDKTDKSKVPADKSRDASWQSDSDKNRR